MIKGKHIRHIIAKRETPRGGMNMLGTIGVTLGTLVAVSVAKFVFSVILCGSSEDDDPL